MKKIAEHIAHVKSKPHHIRKQVAFGAAAALTALIAFIWLTSSLMTGAFALKATSFAESTGNARAVVVSGGDTSEQVAGVGAAVSNKAEKPASVEIVDTTPSSRSNSQVEQTVIPF